MKDKEGDRLIISSDHDLFDIWKELTSKQFRKVFVHVQDEYGRNSILKTGQMKNSRIYSKRVFRKISKRLKQMILSREIQGAKKSPIVHQSYQNINLGEQNIDSDLAFEFHNTTILQSLIIENKKEENQIRESNIDFIDLLQKEDQYIILTQSNEVFTHTNPNNTDGSLESYLTDIPIGYSGKYSSHLTRNLTFNLLEKINPQNFDISTIIECKVKNLAQKNSATDLFAIEIINKYKYDQ